MVKARTLLWAAFLFSQPVNSFDTFCEQEKVEEELEFTLYWETAEARYLDVREIVRVVDDVTLKGWVSLDKDTGQCIALLNGYDSPGYFHTYTYEIPCP